MQQRNIFSTLFIMFFSVILCFTLLLFFYQTDNKYTHKGLQPIAGALYVDKDELLQHGVFFLTKEWQFYPDVLLTPDDFAGATTLHPYMQTITIGKYNNFSLGKPYRTPGGTATYRLSLLLPAEATTYSLTIPEIYSAYDLYVNGEKLVTLGNPHPDHFQEKIKRQTITFIASGITELLLVVSNRSHFFSGITYPPIFGLPSAVHTLETTHIILSVTGCLLAFLCTVLSFYLLCAFHKQSEKKIFLFFGITLCATIVTLYPLLFYYYEISPTVWYGIELLGIYGIYFFTTLLQGEICQMPRAIKRASAIVLGSFCLFALVYGLLPTYSFWLTQTFSVLATLIKYLITVYLLCCALYATWIGHVNSKLLLFCTTAVATSVLFDRLFPFYEPIYGGWPAEYGNMVLILGLGAILWKDIIHGYRFELVFTEEKRQLTKQVAIQQSHYLALTDKIEDTIRIRHDERHHLQILYGLLEQKNYQKLEDYLASYILTAMPKERTILCKNLVVDAMLSYYQSLCLKEAIHFSCEAILPAHLSISDVELSILFGNLLENAYDAAREDRSGHAFLTTKASFDGENLMVLIENSCTTSPQRKGDHFLSSKHPGYGIGTQSVSSVVTTYGGQCSFHGTNQVFTVSIFIPLLT